MSAGTFEPTAISTTSPGTSSTAGITIHLESRRTIATSASYAFSSSIADSAFVSVTTPTVALATKIRTMTPGSTNAAAPVSPFDNAMIRSTTAAAISIFTSKSSNCFRTSL